MGIFLIINALFPVLVGELQQFKVISPTTNGLVTGIEQAVSEFATVITGNTTAVTTTVTSLLAAIGAGVQVLRTQVPTLSPITLSIITATDSAIAAGLAASQITSVDPTKLQTIAPLA
jgi:hypothetical protein